MVRVIVVGLRRIVACCVALVASDAGKWIVGWYVGLCPNYGYIVYVSIWVAGRGTDCRIINILAKNVGFDEVFNELAIKYYWFARSLFN